MSDLQAREIPMNKHEFLSFNVWRVWMSLDTSQMLQGDHFPKRKHSPPPRNW